VNAKTIASKYYKVKQKRKKAEAERGKETESQKKIPKRTEDIQEETEKGRRRVKKMKEWTKAKQHGYNFPPLLMELMARNKNGRMTDLYFILCRILKW
jgi:hypothetical protein